MENRLRMHRFVWTDSSMDCWIPWVSLPSDATNDDDALSLETNVPLSTLRTTGGVLPDSTNFAV
jgi:hypothetical protein